MKVPYFEPWITNDDKNKVLKALTQRWLTNGPFLSKFENKFILKEVIKKQCKELKIKDTYLFFLND